MVDAIIWHVNVVMNFVGYVVSSLSMARCNVIQIWQ
jgi:hypothetical protein